MSVSPPSIRIYADKEEEGTCLLFTTVSLAAIKSLSTQSLSEYLNSERMTIKNE